MAVPEPNSPEAKRVAQKVRNVFYMIAATNFVIVAIILWPRPKLTERTPSKTVPAAAEATRDPILAEMETTHHRLLEAYHGRDAERFAQEFSSAAVPAVDEDYFRTVVIGRYHEEFGELTGRTLTSETNTDPERPILVYGFTSKKGPAGKVRVRFRRDGGRLRVDQWQLEPL